MLEKSKRIHKYNGKSEKTGSDLHETPKMDIIQKVVKRGECLSAFKDRHTLQGKISSRISVIEKMENENRKLRKNTEMSGLTHAT